MTRYGNPRTVFQGGQSDLLNHVAQLSVLYEDLRLRCSSSGISTHGWSLRAGVIRIESIGRSTLSGEHWRRSSSFAAGARRHAERGNSNKAKNAYPPDSRYGIGTQTSTCKNTVRNSRSSEISSRDT